MSDDTYVLKFTGEDKDLVDKIDKITDRLNKSRELSVKFNKERSNIARQERKAAFESLSLEEKRAKLTQRQIDLERRLNTAKKSGNEYRTSALQLAMARNRSTLGGLGQPVAQAPQSGAAASLLGAAGRFAAPAAIVAAITAAFKSSLTSALRFADETSDLAEQMGITRTQVIQISKAAGAAGVNVRQVIGGLSTLSAARSAALGGDPKAQELFKRYGANANEDNILTLAQQITGSLGPGGMESRDRGSMGMLFGRRPESMIAALRAIQDVGNLEADIQRIDEANTKIEAFYNKLKEANLKIVSAVLGYARSTVIGTAFSKLTDMAIGTGPALPTSFADKRRLDDTVLRPSNQSSIKTTAAIPQADSLARMGLYIGGGPNSTAGIMKQQLTELKAIKASSQQTVQSINKI